MRIFILGLPGSGKDYIRNAMTDHYIKQIPHLYSIDVGTILRSRSEHDPYIKRVQSEGGIVDTTKVLDIFEDILDRPDFIISGSPRKPNEAQYILTHPKWVQNPGHLVYLEIDKQTAMNRLLSRQRADDKVEVINNRFDLFYNETMKSIEQFDKMNRLITVDATQTADQILKHLAGLIK